MNESFDNSNLIVIDSFKRKVMIKDKIYIKMYIIMWKKYNIAWKIKL